MVVLILEVSLSCSNAGVWAYDSIRKIESVGIVSTGVPVSVDPYYEVATCPSFNSKSSLYLEVIVVQSIQ